MNLENFGPFSFSAIKIGLVLAVLQLIVASCLFFSYLEFDLVFDSLAWILVELKNSEQGWLVYFEIWGFDVGYFFTASKEELVQYYPNFYWLIHSLGRITKFGLIPLILFLVYRSSSAQNWVKSIVTDYRNVDISSFISLLLGPLSALFIVIVAYFYLVSKVNEPVGYQLWLARIWLLISIVHFGSIVVAQRNAVISAMKRFMFQETLPYSIAIFRILFFGYMIGMYLMVFRPWGTMFIGKLNVDPPRLTSWFWELAPIDSGIYGVACWLSVLCALFIVIGFKTRVALVLHGILCFYVITMPNIFGKIWHVQIMIWISWIMMFSPCFDVLSIDSLKQRGLKKGPYDFHLKLIWLQFGLIYLFGGFHKLWLCGFDWALSESMVNQFRLEWFEHYNLVPSFRIDLFPGFLKASGLLVILFELFFLMFLFWGKLRAAAVVGGLFMHWMIQQFLYISFFSVLVVFYVVFMPWNSLIEKLKKIDLTNMDVIPEVRYKHVYWAPALILVANFWFGLFNVNSFPFSVYPVYASIVPDTVQYLDFVPVESTLDIWEEGELAGFGWENYTRDQYDLISQYNSTGYSDSARVFQHWKLWKNGVPSLQQIEKVDVFLVTRFLNPDNKSERKRQFLMQLDNQPVEN